MNRSSLSSDSQIVPEEDWTYALGVSLRESGFIDFPRVEEETLLTFIHSMIDALSIMFFDDIPSWAVPIRKAYLR